MNLKKIIMTAGLVLLSSQTFANSLVFQLDDLTPYQERRLKQLSRKSSKDVVNVIYDNQIAAILTSEQKSKLKALRSGGSQGTPSTKDWYQDPYRDGKN